MTPSNAKICFQNDTNAIMGDIAFGHFGLHALALALAPAASTRARVAVTIACAV